VDIQYFGLLLAYRLMLKKYLILIVSVILACVVAYLAGYRAGAKLPEEGARQGSLIMGVALYQTMETNQAMAQRILGKRIANMARGYEQRFGIPKGTNAFAQLFMQAKVIADRVAKAPVLSGEASTNLESGPLPDVPLQPTR
jgi:hypothetical protein